MAQRNWVGCPELSVLSGPMRKSLRSLCFRNRDDHIVSDARRQPELLELIPEPDEAFHRAARKAALYVGLDQTRQSRVGGARTRRRSRSYPRQTRE
jgi:hypothetical protein